ncbi:MAG: hypothetical protein MK171_00455 [Pirellulales bacterium]|nr:hypothetical protein [Pirellulales bacterium]
MTANSIDWKNRQNNEILLGGNMPPYKLPILPDCIRIAVEKNEIFFDLDGPIGVFQGSGSLPINPGVCLCKNIPGTLRVIFGSG